MPHSLPTDCDRRLHVGPLVIERRAAGQDEYYWVASTDHTLRTGSPRQIVDGLVTGYEDLRGSARSVKLEVWGRAIAELDRIVYEADGDDLDLDQLAVMLSERLAV